MEAPPESPARRPWLRRRKLVVIIAAVVVAAAAFAAWEILRARSIGEVYAMSHLAAGAQIPLQGTITGVARENTSYGPRVYLQLDHSTACGGPSSGDVLGDPNASYRIGDSYGTTLHLQSFTINGDPAVWTPQLVCPFPALERAIGEVLDAVSVVDHVRLIYNGSDAGQWSHYEILTENGDGFRPDILPVVLLKARPVQGSNPELPAGGPVDSAARFQTLAGLLYLEMSGAVGGPFFGFDVADRMLSLSAGTSSNGSLRFVDGNGNGLADSGDRIDVHLPSSVPSNTWNVYLLEVGDFSSAARTYVGGVHVILAGPGGPLEVPLPDRTAPVIDFRYAGSTGGSLVNTTIEVSRVHGAAPALSIVQVSVTMGTETVATPLSGLPTTFPNGATLSFSDTNGDGRLDSGDRFTMQNIGNHTVIRLVLQATNAMIGSGAWIAGWGPIVGDPPYWVTFQTQGTNPWRATATVASWSPELALNRTLRATLTENGSPVLSNVTLANGTARAFANGTLTFTDADGDGFLSTGDFFSLQGNSADRYVLEVWYLFNSRWLALSV